MFLLVGLGNPGSEYKLNRHNVGFMAVDSIIEAYSFGSPKKVFKSNTFSGNIGDHKVLIIKPNTYMNESGKAVQAASSFYSIEPKNILVFQDEIDLSLGKIKVKVGGSSAGHNGIKDIDANIGKEYVRVRIGVDRPSNPRIDVADYVLSNFAKDEISKVSSICDSISKNCPLLFDNKTDLFTTRVIEENK